MRVLISLIAPLKSWIVFRCGNLIRIYIIDRLSFIRRVKRYASINLQSVYHSKIIFVIFALPVTLLLPPSLSFSVFAADIN